MPGCACGSWIEILKSEFEEETSTNSYIIIIIWINTYVKYIAEKIKKTTGI